MRVKAVDKHSVNRYTFCCYDVRSPMVYEHLCLVGAVCVAAGTVRQAAHHAGRGVDRHMRIRVRLFAVAKQAARRDAVDLDLPQGATIRDLRRQLGSRIPQLSGLVGQMMFAVNTHYADDATTIPPGADVACIPPVSGG